MAFDFSPETKYDSPNSLVPANTLAFARLKVKGLSKSNNTGGEYADIDLILMGQFENRHVFPVVMNPSDTKNSEAARNMGMAALQHICEASGLFDHKHPETYQRFSNAGFTDVLKAIDGGTVAIKVGIEKGNDGYQDKNRVLAWLTPNPNSSDFKQWEALKGKEVSGQSASQADNSRFDGANNSQSQAGTNNASGASGSDSSGGKPDWLV